MVIALKITEALIEKTVDFVLDKLLTPMGLLVLALVGICIQVYRVTHPKTDLVILTDRRIIVLSGLISTAHGISAKKLVELPLEDMQGYKRRFSWSLMPALSIDLTGAETLVIGQNRFWNRRHLVKNRAVSIMDWISILEEKRAASRAPRLKPELPAQPLELSGERRVEMLGKIVRNLLAWQSACVGGMCAFLLLIAISAGLNPLWAFVAFCAINIYGDEFGRPVFVNMWGPGDLADEPLRRRYEKFLERRYLQVLARLLLWGCVLAVVWFGAYSAESDRRFRLKVTGESGAK